MEAQLSPGEQPEPPGGATEDTLVTRPGPAQGPGWRVKNPPGKPSLQQSAPPPAVQVSPPEVTDIMELRPVSPAVASSDPHNP